jgi:tetratricopeptide (TPR) repeat protein
MWDALRTAIGTERADLLLELSQRATYRNSCEEALSLAEEARDGLIKAGADETIMVRAYTAISYALASLNRKGEAAQMLGKVVEISRRSEDPFIDDHLRTQAMWYVEMKDWQAALDCQLEAVRLNEIDGDQQWLARSLYLTGSCYQNMKDYPLAIEHYKRARVIYKAEKNVTEIGNCDIWIGESYASLGNGELALTYGNQALDISRLMNRTPWIVLGSIVVGKAYSILADFEKAEKALDEAHFLLVNDTSDQWHLIIEIKSELANIYRQTNRSGLADEVEARIATIREILE